MCMDRNLVWDGIFNARDLGGLRTDDGHRTRWSALVRSDGPDRLTEVGWTALYEHGIRTIIDLRNDDERGLGETTRPSDLDIVHLPLDPVDDHEFWDYYRSSGLHGTPLYYQPLLDRHPHLMHAVVTAVARARPGGVLFHCASGRDRTGLAAILLLALVGVPATTIAEDYEISIERLPALYSAQGRQNVEPVIAGMLAARGASARDIVVSTVQSLTTEGYLRELAIPDQDLAALRVRLLTTD